MELVLDAKATLGEGPAWDATSNQLYWVDIAGHALHVYTPSTNTDRFIQVGQWIGAAVPRESGGLVLALQHGFYHLDLETEALTLLCDVESDIAHNRFNDGKCDAHGRFWAGTMDIEEKQATGALYCLDTDLQVRKVIHPVGTSNGLGWSPDNRYMYYIDTPTRHVMRFDYNLATGEISNGRPVVTITNGYPDGMSVDAEGMIWVAHWGGSCITRWNPESGVQLDEYRFPASLITSCTFGGFNLQDLYVTSARTALSEEEKRAQPSAGGLFRLNVPATGLPTYAFRG